MAHNFNTYTINHMMAKGLQRLYLEKRECETAPKKPFGFVCIFSAGYLPTIFKEGICAGENNGIFGGT